MTQWTVKYAQLYSFWVFLLAQQIFENFRFRAMKEDCYHGLNLKFPNCSTKDVRGLWNLVDILRKILSTLSNRYNLLLHRKGLQHILRKILSTLSNRYNLLLHRKGLQQSRNTTHIKLLHFFIHTLLSNALTMILNISETKMPL
jgi:hypothetical protein